MIPFMRGALGPIRNRKTVEKIIQNRKTEKILSKSKTARKTVKTDTFSHPCLIKTLIDPM